MIESIYMGITFIVLIIFYKLIRKSIIYTNYPLVSVFFLFKFFIFAYIGTIIHMVVQGYYDNTYYLNQFILSSATLILLPLGMLLATKITSNDGNFNYHYDIEYKVNDKMFYIFI